MKDDQNHDMAYFHDDMATFGDRLAAAREEQGLDQAQLARRLGIRLTTLAGWEEDRAEPRANKLQMLAGLLGVSITWLLSGQGEGPEADLMELLAELRRVRVEQARLTERLAILEKRLRAAIG